MGTRIGFPNEHLAGGHAESLMNPMYSTCIGLILRGYHDFESGKMRFTGDGGNYLRITEEELKPLMEEMPSPAPLAEELIPEVQQEVTRQKVRKRNEKVKNLFNGLKGKFMQMFEDVEDKEIE